jgi:hypothetical protein
VALALRLKELAARQMLLIVDYSQVEPLALLEMTDLHLCSDYKKLDQYNELVDLHSSNT